MNGESFTFVPIGTTINTPVGSVQPVRVNYREAMPCQICAFNGRKRLCSKYVCVAQRRIDNTSVYFKKV